MFARVAASDPLSQGDLIGDCPLVGMDTATAPLNLNDPPTKWWTERIIVLTQSCDLVQSKADSVLVASVHDAQKLVERGILKGAVIRDQVRRHLVFGGYFIPAAPVRSCCRNCWSTCATSIRCRAWCWSS